MKWTSALSEQPVLDDAIAECAAAIKTSFGDVALDLAVAFISPHYEDSYERVAELMAENLGARHVFGCSGGGVIGNGLEIEQRAGVSITAAVLPDVDIKPFHLQADRLPDLDAGPDNWETLIGVEADLDPHFVMVADPYSFPVQDLLMGMDFAFPRATKIGGLASGASRQGGNALFLDGQVLRAGAIGLALYGNITVDTVVAQGCRPIGQPMRITKSDRNMLLELDGRPPMEIIRSMFQELPERDRELLGHSLFLGVVMDELIENPVQGDFLIRNVVGMDSNTGGLAVGEMLKEGQLVQFHLRDAETSAADLQAVLSRYADENRENEIPGALLFSCLGRGQYLYGRPNHDTDIFREKLGAVPLGGFFCNGEIGPVSGTTFLHGYTSSFGLFRPKL
ncbi:MAG: FIST C-terminal domain-containing protein [Chloroflexi bacterium]|nr:FIST C-terminal domain-containing protein [Chloroflexota bacterium]